MTEKRLPRPQPVRERLYKTFIEPKQLEQNARNRELVFNILLFGTGVFSLVLLLLLLYSYFVGGNLQVISRIFVASVAVGLTVGLRFLARRVSYYTAAYALVGFYFLLAAGSVAAWGIGTPFGIILLGLVIVLASTLLGSRHALYAAALAGATVIIVQIGNQAGWLVSRPSTYPVQPLLADAIGEAVVFAILATVSWLFGREMERSLNRAEAAEIELEQEKATLEVRVAERTAQLKQAQIEEMHQLYRFAEVGQLSTALLHDLANYLNILTLEIGSIHSKDYDEALARCREAIRRLNALLREVRGRLAEESGKRNFNLLSAVNEVVASSLHKHKSSHVQLTWDPPANRKPYEIYGDMVKCSQVIAILVDNAIDAYSGKRPFDGAVLEVIVRAESGDNEIRVTITDWGSGITSENRANIFKPDFTTKKNGMGIGLYLARQMVVTEFSGSLELSPVTGRSEFVVILPLKANRPKK